MNKNILLIIDNGFAWAGVLTAIAISVLPILQVLAGTAALIFSILSIIKICKNWYEQD
jgi:hypothetical protein